MGRVEDRTCRRCGRRVRVSAARYHVFEGMHYVCFHYEFEHDPYDPDEECSAGGCPSRAVNARPERRLGNVLAVSELLRGLADRLTVEQQRSGEELVTHGEPALALEMFADWLSDAELPVTGAERETFRWLAEEFGNGAHVMGALDGCPDRP